MATSSDCDPGYRSARCLAQPGGEPRIRERRGCTGAGWQTFGPKADFGAAVDFRNPRMALGGQVRFDNSSGPLRMSEFGATFRTVDNPRHQFSLEAGYRPEARDAFVKVGWTFTFGGGEFASVEADRSDAGTIVARAAVADRGTAGADLAADGRAGAA